MFSECGTIHQPPAFVLVISLSTPRLTGLARSQSALPSSCGRRATFDGNAARLVLRQHLGLQRFGIVVA
jgi:hypothetical protein